MATICRLRQRHSMQWDLNFCLNVLLSIRLWTEIRKVPLTEQVVMMGALQLLTGSTRAAQRSQRRRWESMNAVTCVESCKRRFAGAVQACRQLHWSMLLPSTQTAHGNAPSLIIHTVAS